MAGKRGGKRTIRRKIRRTKRTIRRKKPNPHRSKRIPHNKGFMKDKEWIAVMHPPRGIYNVMPHQWFSTMNFEYLCYTPTTATFQIGQANSLGQSVTNYCTIATNCLRSPMGQNTSNPGTQTISTTGVPAVGNANGGIDGLPLAPFSVTDDVPNSRLMGSIYLNYYVYRTDIHIEVIINTSIDQCEAVLVPVGYNQNLSIPTGAQNPWSETTKVSAFWDAIHSDRAVVRLIEYCGQAGKSNQLNLTVTTAELAGRPGATVQEMISAGDDLTPTFAGSFVPTSGLPAAPGIICGVLFALRILSNAVNVSLIEYRIKMRHHVVFFNAKPIVTEQ